MRQIKIKISPQMYTKIKKNLLPELRTILRNHEEIANSYRKCPTSTLPPAVVECYKILFDDHSDLLQRMNDKKKFKLMHRLTRQVLNQLAPIDQQSDQQSTSRQTQTQVIGDRKDLLENGPQIILNSISAIGIQQTLPIEIAQTLPQPELQMMRSILKTPLVNPTNPHYFNQQQQPFQFDPNLHKLRMAARNAKALAKRRQTQSKWKPITQKKITSFTSFFVQKQISIQSQQLANSASKKQEKSEKIENLPVQHNYKSF